MSVSACGRVAFDDRHDARTDDATAIPRCDWSRGPTFGPVTAHPALTTTVQELDPILVRGDSLTMYYASLTGGTADIYRTRRTSVDAAFSTGELVAELSGPTADAALAVDTTGAGYMTRSAADSNLVEVTSDGTTFSIVRTLTELDGGFHEFDPWVSSDGLELWFTQQSPTTSDQSIYWATRSTTSEPWSNQQRFVHSFDNQIEGSPSLTPDRLTIVWTAGDANNLDIHYATRPSVEEPWSAPQRVAFNAMNTHEVEPSIREDGCELFFVRCPIPGTDWDIYSVSVTVP